MIQLHQTGEGLEARHEDEEMKVCGSIVVDHMPVMGGSEVFPAVPAAQPKGPPVIFGNTPHPKQSPCMWARGPQAAAPSWALKAPPACTVTCRDARSRRPRPAVWDPVRGHCSSHHGCSY
mmetsp:Transcript_26010/g.46095  ORF Transcript_26010/g.46095 Transcript_26010/m.46095 type:complete len:120 (-) Transcript_26010:117-476(-)